MDQILKPGEVSDVPGKNLTEKLAWLKVNARSNKEYFVKVGANERIDNVFLEYDNRTNIKINMSGGSVTSKYEFTVADGVMLTLSNVALNSNWPGIIVGFGGILVMETGSRIAGWVFTVGTIIMNGGTISGSAFGGWVSVGVGGSFFMNGGVISGNTDSGVRVEGGTFTMNGGVISGNKASYGGGVYLDGGTFRIVNGTIYGSNEADTSLRNTASSGAALYRGAGTAQHGTFIEKKWVSSGDLSTTNNTIKVVDGDLE
jgi:hypothetical protein